MIVAVIGAGKIGEAVANSITKSGQVTKVITTKRDVSTAARQSRSEKVVLTSDNREAAKSADIILIAVKAGDAKHVLGEISQFTADKIDVDEGLERGDYPLKVEFFGRKRHRRPTTHISAETQ